MLEILVLKVSGKIIFHKIKNPYHTSSTITCCIPHFFSRHNLHSSHVWLSLSIHLRCIVCQTEHDSHHKSVTLILPSPHTYTHTPPCLSIIFFYQKEIKICTTQKLFLSSKTPTYFNQRELKPSAPGNKRHIHYFLE